MYEARGYKTASSLYFFLKILYYVTFKKILTEHNLQFVAVAEWSKASDLFNAVIRHQGALRTFSKMSVAPPSGHLVQFLAEIVSKFTKFFF